MSEAASLEIDRVRQSRASGEAGAGVWSRGLEELPKGMPLGRQVIFSSLTINLLSLGLPIAILQVYDRILPNTATQTLLLLVIGLIGVLLLDAVLRMARSYVTGWSAARYEHQTACRAADRLLAAPVGDFEKDAPGVHLDRLNAVDTLRDFNAGQARLILTDLPFVLIFIGLMWQIAGKLALVPVALLCILALAAGAVGFFLRGALEERAQLDDRRYNFIIEVLTGILTVKGLAMEPLILRRYERLQESGAASTYRCTFFSSLAQGIGSVFSSLAMVSVAAIGAVYVIAGELSIGALAACTLLSARSIQPMLRALGLWAQFQGIQVARERLDNLFAIEPETAGRNERLERIAGRIELKGVSFGYDEETPLFDKLDLSVEPSEVIGISGGTGNGKSTLLMLMLGALRADEGEVKIDGLDVTSQEPELLRRQIAYLPQTPVLFQGTILQNLTMFGDDDMIEDALAAAKLLGLDRIVDRLPAGYETMVGDGASEELPNGARQSIVIARALVGHPGIILFDEANSTLDGKADAALKETLSAIKGGPTMILVSHRPSLLALADRVYDLVEGRLVQRQAEDKTAPPQEARPAAAEAGGLVVELPTLGGGPAAAQGASAS